MCKNLCEKIVPTYCVHAVLDDKLICQSLIVKTKKYFVTNNFTIFFALRLFQVIY